MVSRLIAPHLSQVFFQSVVVENRPGAGALIGTDMVSKQAVDGYMLRVSHAGLPKASGLSMAGAFGTEGLARAHRAAAHGPNPQVLVKADVATRLEDLQALPRNPALLGDDFVRWVRSQIDAWHTVANNVIVEVIG